MILLAATAHAQLFPASRLSCPGVTVAPGISCDAVALPLEFVPDGPVAADSGGAYYIFENFADKGAVAVWALPPHALAVSEEVRAHNRAKIVPLVRTDGSPNAVIEFGLNGGRFEVRFGVLGHRASAWSQRVKLNGADLDWVGLDTVEVLDPGGATRDVVIRLDVSNGNGRVSQCLRGGLHLFEFVDCPAAGAAVAGRLAGQLSERVAAPGFRSGTDWVLLDQGGVQRRLFLEGPSGERQFIASWSVATDGESSATYLLPTSDGVTVLGGRLGWRFDTRRLPLQARLGLFDWELVGVYPQRRRCKAEVSRGETADCWDVSELHFYLEKEGENRVLTGDDDGWRMSCALGGLPEDQPFELLSLEANDDDFIARGPDGEQWTLSCDQRTGGKAPRVTTPGRIEFPAGTGKSWIERPSKGCHTVPWASEGATLDLEWCSTGWVAGDIRYGPPRATFLPFWLMGDAMELRRPVPAWASIGNRTDAGRLRLSPVLALPPSAPDWMRGEGADIAPIRDIPSGVDGLPPGSLGLPSLGELAIVYFDSPTGEAVLLGIAGAPRFVYLTQALLFGGLASLAAIVLRRRLQVAGSRWDNWPLGVPVNDPEWFFGDAHHAWLTTLAQALMNKGALVVVTSQPRSGKTSLTRLAVAAVSEQMSSAPLHVEVDLSTIPVDEVLPLIVRAMSTAIGLPDVPRDLVALRIAVAAWQATPAGRPVLLVLDEAQALYEGAAGVRGSRHIRQNLRGFLSMGAGDIRAVLSGVNLRLAHRLDERAFPGSSMLNTVSEWVEPPVAFTSDDCAAIFRTATERAGLQPTEEATRRFVGHAESVRGAPMAVMYLAYAVYLRSKRLGAVRRLLWRTRLSASDVDDICGSVLSRPDPAYPVPECPRCRISRSVALVCRKCGAEQETDLNSGSAATVECPKCGSGDVRRVLTCGNCGEVSAWEPLTVYVNLGRA